ncbi:MAG TPA: PepSY domain-containing protein [Solirubrobacteraceae bacterium]|nr:PepSY domain-containing protein [Solirubrobacteraceae bacterium]
MTSSGKRALLAIAAVAAVAGTGAAIAGATGGDDEDAARPITGSALREASAAALEHTGGGRVTDTEAGDEEGAYEVEVTRADGSQVDVHLDERFGVIGAEGDDDGREDE